MLNHPIRWDRHQPIEPLPIPYPWRRMAFGLAFTALLIALGAVVVAL